MGFGKSIKDALWTSDDAPKVVPVPTPATTAAPAPSIPTQLSSAPAPVATVYSPINEDMVKDIQEAVDSANLPGYDYLELKAAVNAMSALPLSEEHKYAAAFASASASNSGSVTKSGILGSIDHYVGIVDGTEQAFMAKAADKEKREIQGRDDKIALIDGSIKDMAEQITKLTGEITAKQEEKTKLMTEKVEQQQKIDNARNSYKATADHVRKALLADKAKIDTALPSLTIVQEPING